MRQLRTLFVWVWSMAFTLSGASLALPQGKRPMTLIDLLEVPILSEPQLSPDGHQLVFVLAEADWKENKRVRHIWRVNADGTRLLQLTNGRQGESSPRWSPDGKQIAFIAKRGSEKGNQIYLIRNDGGEAQRLTRHEGAGGREDPEEEKSLSNPSWSPDGAFVYFLAADPETEKEKDREQAKDDVYAFDENFKQRHLWRISVAETTEERITEGDFSVLRYRLSRDGTKIAFHRAPTPLYDDFDEGEVWVMDSDGKGAMRLTTNAVAERGGEPSPDNQWVLFVSDSNEKFETYYNDNVFVVPARGGQARMLLADMPYEVQQASWSGDGESIFFTANTGVRSELFRVDLATEDLEQLTDGKHTVRSWSFEPRADRHVFSIDEPSNAGDVWMLPAKGEKPPTRITRVYDYLDRAFELPRQEAIKWKGADGMMVEGLLFYPLDYQQAKRYPLVVQTHGGPASSDKYRFGRWSKYVQVLTAKGYAVFQPNYRGSTGYGDEFLRDMVGHYYRQSHLDVMAGVDYLIQRGVADAERMVKMGWSGGGHMTNKIITHTDRFKAASSGAGAVNWISMYGQSDVRIYRTPWFGGTPWQKDAPIDLYWEHSPLKDIWKVKTPTIVLVGENDERVPPPQSIELYRALKSNGVPTHLYMAPREPHGWRELRHQLFKMNVELDWFEKHAMGRKYTWEKPPAEREQEGTKATTP